LSVCQRALQIGSRWTGIDLLALGRVEDTFARGAGLGGALVKGLADLIGRGVQVQRDGSLGAKRVCNGVQTELVVHVCDSVSLEEGLLFDGHDLGLFFVITVVTALTRVSAFTLVNDLIRPVVKGFFQLAIKDLHETVGTRMVMNSAGNNKEKRTGTV